MYFIAFLDKHDTKYAIRLDDVSYIKIYDNDAIIEIGFRNEIDFPLIAHVSVDTLVEFTKQIVSFVKQ